MWLFGLDKWVKVGYIPCVGEEMAGLPRYFGLATTSMDAKNRITIPAKFRSKLPTSSDGKTLLYVMVGADFKHLDIFDQDSGQARIEALTGQTGLPGEAQRQRQQLLAMVEQVELDKQGRVLLPKSHVAFANLKSEVMVSGAGDHIQLYDSSEAEAGNAPVSIEKLNPSAVSALYNRTLPEQG
jgi:MraZ protein